MIITLKNRKRTKQMFRRVLHRTPRFLTQLYRTLYGKKIQYENTFSSKSESENEVL